MSQSPNTDKIVESLKNSLIEAIDANLLSIIRHGLGSQSDTIQILVVVDNFENDVWERLGQAFESTKKRKQLSPMLVTHQELISSTDVFPLTFLEMKRKFEVVYGADVLTNLDIRQIHLRLRCEQELKNSLFRMQTTFFRHTNSRKHLLAAMKQHFGAFKRALIGCSILYGQAAPEDDNGLIENAAANLRLDAETLRKANALVEGDTKHDIEWLKSLFVGIMAQIQSAANEVDQMADEVEVIELSDSED